MIHATSRSVNLENIADSPHAVTAEADELVMVWDHNRHIANVINGESEVFARHANGQWGYAPPTGT